VNKLRLVVLFLWNAFKTYFVDMAKRQSEVNSGAADQRSADAAANAEAEKKAQEVSDAVDSDPDLAARAERLFGRKADRVSGESNGRGIGP
jgi:hypothetical protein